MTEQRPIHAGIIDFNTKKMPAEEAAKRNIPADLRPYLADWRQYALHFGEHLPDYVS